MTVFNNFSKSEWSIFYGNLLMLIVCIFYIAWWTVSFRPGRTAAPGISLLLISLTVISAIASVSVLARGLSSASRDAGGSNTAYIFIGAAALYVVFFIVTRIALHRPLTTELFIIILWTAGELSVVDALHRAGRFGIRSSVVLIVLTAAAAVVGIVCYILYYRLDEASGFRAGLIPLAVDAGVVTTFLTAQAIL